MSSWEKVCRLDQLPLDRGVAALLGGQQIALFRLSSGQVFAVSNQDPFSAAMVIARGLVGSRGDAPTVASPMYKQVFDLSTGICLDDADVRLASYPVRIAAGSVEVSLAVAQRQPA